MSHQIIWPPEDDANSWPPKGNYGSIQDCQHVDCTCFLVSEDHISSSPSSSSSSESGGRREQDYQRFYSSRHYRYTRSLFTVILAISLSAAVWLPLLQEQPKVEQHEEYSSDTSSAPPWGYLRAYHDDDEESENDYLDSSSQDSSPSNSSTYPYPASYGHRHYDRMGESDYDRNHSITGNEENGTESHSINPIDNGSLSIPANISFADLAAMLLPPYFQKTLDLCASTIVPVVTTTVDDTTSLDYADGSKKEGSDDILVTTTSVMPSEIYLLRKTILKTRDLFDVFSPVYSKHSSLDDYEQGDETSREHISWGDGRQQFELIVESDTHGRQTKNRKDKEETSHSLDGDKTTEMKDLWKTLRRFLNNGYMLIGDLQDLDHAKIKYTPEQLARYQLQVWQWNEGFLSFVEENRHHISLYLSLPCKKKKHPTSKDVRCQHAHSHSSHLFWGNATSHELPDGNLDGATSTLWRLGSSQLERAEMYLSKALAYEHVIFVPEEAIIREDGVHEIYHNLRKELRSFVDELDLFGDLLLPDLSLIPGIEKERANKDRNTAADQAPLLGHQQQTNIALRSLRRARKLLGDMNDDYVAYLQYIEWQEYPEEMDRLHKDVETQWTYFRIWAQEVELFAKIQLLRVEMDPSDVSLGEEVVQGHSSDGIYRE